MSVVYVCFFLDIFLSSCCVKLPHTRNSFFPRAIRRARQPLGSVQGSAAIATTAFMLIISIIALVNQAISYFVAVGLVGAGTLRMPLNNVDIDEALSIGKYAKAFPRHPHLLHL